MKHNLHVRFQMLLINKPSFGAVSFCLFDNFFSRKTITFSIYASSDNDHVSTCGNYFPWGPILLAEGISLLIEPDSRCQDQEVLIIYGSCVFFNTIHSNKPYDEVPALPRHINRFLRVSTFGEGPRERHSG